MLVAVTNFPLHDIYTEKVQQDVAISNEWISCFNISEMLFFSPYFNDTLNYTKYNKLKMLPFTIVFILLRFFFFASFYSLDKSLYNSVVKMVTSLKIQLATLTCAHWDVSLIFYVFF